jgi:hypothetical protein
VYDLSKFSNRTGRIGRPLPDPFPQAFGRNGIHFRHGATSMLAGRPGSYKSIIALNLAVVWAKRGTVLHFAADSDEATVAKRMVSIITGDSTDSVEKAFEANKVSHYVDALSKPLESMRFVYRQMDMDGIANQVAAFEAVYGDYPDVIFLDNLINFVDRPDDWGGMLLLTKELDGLARETKSHICILHHARIDKDSDSGSPPDDNEIQGRVTQIPRTVITVGARWGQVTLSCEKNTNGPQKMGWLNFQVLPNFRLIDSTDALQREQMA